MPKAALLNGEVLPLESYPSPMGDGVVVSVGSLSVEAPTLEDALRKLFRMGVRFSWA
ncbi:MAG: hypothetical protein ACP6IQ_01815 [Candidatus Njordarchaeia archaeon]